MKHLILTALTLILLSPNTYAETLPLPEGATRLHLSTTLAKEVMQDTLIATLAFTHEEADQNTVQSVINSAIKDALKITDDYKDVKISTPHYNVHQYDPNRHKKNLPSSPVWHGEQTIQLKGKKDKTVLELAGKLQTKGFHMQSLSHSTSPTLIRQTQDDLMEDALKQLITKAERAGTALGKLDVDLQDVRVNAPPSHHPVARHAIMAKTMDAPAAKAAEHEITLTVSATAIAQ